MSPSMLKTASVAMTRCAQSPLAANNYPGVPHPDWVRAVVALCGSCIRYTCFSGGKLHLVDLAGSERVYKTGNAGTLLRESKFINASLHFLEMVIVALQERSTGKKRSHIPYRNSMMTSVLRDSLGGNCKTSMIATMNPDRAHTDESLSTCRFAQRVACVSNAVKVNEEVDPQMVIRRLKKEVADLREELALVRGAGADHDQDVRLLSPSLSVPVFLDQTLFICAWDHACVRA